MTWSSRPLAEALAHERATHRAVIRWRALYSRMRPRMTDGLHWRLKLAEDAAIQEHRSAEHRLREAAQAAGVVLLRDPASKHARWRLLPFPSGPTECPKCTEEAKLIGDTVGRFPPDKTFNADDGYSWAVCVVHKTKWVIGPKMLHLRQLDGGIHWPQVEPCVREREKA